MFAWWTVKALLYSISGGEVSEGLTATLNWQVLLFALGLALLTGLLCGLYPAWDAARNSVAGVLREQSGQSSASMRSARVRRILVCAQVMVAAVLLIPTGLFLKSMVNLLHVDLGVNADRLVTFNISPRLSGYTPERCRALFERAEQELAAIPGVRGVAASMVQLIAGNNWGSSLTVEGYPTDPHADTNSMLNAIGAGFFREMGVPLIAGREFTGRDTMAGPKVAIVNQTFARHFFGNGNPLGRKFAEGMGNKVMPDTEIVGVVRDSHYSGVKQKVPRLFYRPWRQSKETGFLAFYVRGALPADQIMPQIRRVMHSLDADLPLEGLRTFDDQVSRNILGDRIVLQLSASFAVLATLLAMLGLYGVMAYNVTRRTREIGIRIALGAQGGRIRAMVMREMAVIAGVGLLVGIPASVALAKLTESELFGVKSFDVTVIAGAALALAAASALAGYLPARRATRIEPTRALRYE